MHINLDYNESAGDWLNYILIKAISSRASDIHFEPERNKLNVRFRIDGVMYPCESIQKIPQEMVSSKIKVLSSIDITEHRLPQDGHFEFNYQGTLYNFRVSTLPSIFGETIVLRIFNIEDSLIKLNSVGFEKDQEEIVNKLINSPSGIILITGPTGSGKTSLLYSILDVLNKPDKNIITLEDPIEFIIPNLRQTEIKDLVGLTFSKTLRSVFRQDPDIIMLGEIRDAETAQMAMQAALTGILIFSTFHTFDVPALIARLMEMGIPNSVIAQAIKGMISTRLMRKVCATCRKPYQPTESDKKFLIGIDCSQTNFQKGRGCNLCQAGYKGRTGIYEVIYFDDDLKTAIVERKPLSFIKELLIRKKTKSLKTTALNKACQGITSLEEVIRVVGYLN